MSTELLVLFNSEVFSKAWHYLLKGWPVWLPLIILNLSFGRWLDYIRRKHIAGQGSVLLEIKLPRDVPKSPAAMELVLNGLWEPSAPSSLADAFWEGKIRDWFSLEIVSIGGEVKFFIWALPRWKKIIETRIYGQYPGAEVVEAKDYAMEMHYDPENFPIWGITTKLNKADAYPIKTYIDYEMDKSTGNKEQDEFIDPITPVIEYLGSLKDGEIAAIQILIQAHRKEGLLDGKIIVKPDWGGGIKSAIKDIIEKEAPIKAEKDKPASLMALTDSQKETIKAIERNAGKLAYDTMIRMIYMAPKDSFDRVRGMGLIGSTRQFGSTMRNGIRPDRFMSVAYPWQDFRDMQKKAIQGTFVESYRRRSFFNTPFKHFYGKPFILTTEELATIFHLPGAVASTPTLKRSPSKKAEAPANLPI